MLTCPTPAGVPSSRGAGRGAGEGRARAPGSRASRSLRERALPCPARRPSCPSACRRRRCCLRSPRWRRRRRRPSPSPPLRTHGTAAVRNRGTASTARGQPSTRAAAPWRRTGFGLRHLGLRGRLLLRRGLLLGGRHGGGGCAGGGAAGSVVVVAIRPSGRRKPPRIRWMIADGANAGWVAAALLLAGTHTHLACASYHEGVRPSAAGERAG